MALGAIPDVLRELGFVEQDAGEVVVYLDQEFTLMDSVYQDREVPDGHAIGNVGRCTHREGVSRGIGNSVGLSKLALIGVADHAVFRVIAAAAVEGGAVGAGNAAELAVAFVAA